MAKEDGKPTAAEKGKGKATDKNTPDNDGKREEAKATQDAKVTINGKKEDEPQEGLQSKASQFRSIADMVFGCRGVERGRPATQK